MTAGTIVFLVIWGLVSLIFVGVGIASGNSGHPVGINTSEKVPKAEEMTDVKAYNLAHRKMWFAFTGIFDTIGLFWLLTARFWMESRGIAIALTVLTVVLVLGDVFLVELVHSRLLRRYHK